MAKLHNFLASPVTRICAFVLLLLITLFGLLAIREYKEPVKEQTARAIKKAQDFTYDFEVKEFSAKNTALEPGREDIPNAEPEGRAERPEREPAFSGMPRKAQGGAAPQNQRKTPVNRQLRAKKPIKNRVENILPLCLYAKTTNSGTTVVSSDVDIAPYGRQIRCELANTITSSATLTPVIALVTEPLWWDGVEIIPAGVEVHGTVSGMSGEDRISTSSSWKVIYPFRDERSAYQLDLTGVALDCNRTTGSWGKSDGSYGIRGILKSNADMARIAGFFAKFISGIGSGMASQQYDYIGNSTISTTGGKWQDAIGKGLESAFEEVAKNYLQQASKEIAYVEAEAGTEFYIYVTQVIDPAQAARGKMTASNNQLTRGEGKLPDRNDRPSRSNTPRVVFPQEGFK